MMLKFEDFLVGKSEDTSFVRVLLIGEFVFDLGFCDSHVFFQLICIQCINDVCQHYVKSVIYSSIFF